MSKLQLLLLGHFECLLPSGERISLSMRKAEVLLAYLALAPGIRHPRERLINLLWSDRGEEQARNSLRQCLSAIKKSLGDAADLVIQVDRTSVCLKPEMIDIDALEFERLATIAEFESLSDAAALYRGEFLEGISIRDAASQEWLDSERSRFKRQYIEILTNLGHTLLASHDHNGAIKTTERLVAEDTLGESGWRLLMRAYCANGDRSHALQAFKRCQQALRSELEVEPEAATLELRNQIATSQMQPAQTPIRDVAPAAIETEAPSTTDNRETPVDSTQTSDHSIAVLPFDNLSGDPEQEYFSDGISESIILHLNLFPELIVKSRNSSFAFKQQIKGLGEISEELGVEYLVEGSVRKSAEQIRITVQLVEAASGNQVWGKRYDAPLDDLFSLEEDLSRSIAATVTGQIESDLQRIALTKGAAEQQAYDLLLAGHYHLARFTPQDNAIAIEKFNLCLEQDPDSVRAHALLCGAHGMDRLERWSSDYQLSSKRAQEHIDRAMELDPGLSMVQTFYAELLTFNGKFALADKHLDKALAINPNDPEVFAVNAAKYISKGDFAAAIENATHAFELDPYHPWAEWEMTAAQYFSESYEAALETIAGARTSPGFETIFAIAANIKLGQIETARQVLQEFLQQCRETMKSMPRNLEEWYDYTRSYYLCADSRYNQDLVDCLVQAGLEDHLDSPQKQTQESSHTIAVLPFDNLSGDPGQEYFSDGISESIILHLNLFPGLSVKSRSSSFAFKQQIKSLGEISSELGVDYIVEGSLRKSTDQIRITVQLIEAASGNQVWGKRYDAPLADLFSLEEELSRRIAATVTGQIESDLQRIAVNKGAADQQAYDLLLAGIYHLHRSDRDNISIAFEKFEQCLKRDPDNLRAHSLLYQCHILTWMDRLVEDYQGSFDMAGDYARRSLALDPERGEAQYSYGEYLMFCHRPEEAGKHFDRALAVSPNSPDYLTAKAMSFSMRGDFDAALELATSTYELDPNNWWADWNLAEAQFLCGRYQEAVDTLANSKNAPGFIRIYAIAANVKLGNMNTARQSLEEYLQTCRESMRAMPQTLDDWLQYSVDTAPFVNPQINQDIVDCLVQAGLGDACASALQSDRAEQPAILVLPFSNLSGDPEQDYFCDGITDSIIASLGAFSGPRVKSRHTSFAFSNSNRSIDEIAAELDVNYIVEGSIRKSGNRVRINVQLVESENGDQLWAKRFDADFEDLFTLEEDLTRTIAATISGRVGKELKSQSLHKSTQNMQSYDYLMRGLYHLEKFSRDDNLIAREQFQKSIEHDPRNCEAHSLLAETWVMELYENWTVDRDEARRMSRLHAEKAIELEPDNALAHAFMSEQLLIDREFERSLTHAERAIELNPTLPDGYSMKCGVLGLIRRYQEALENADISMQIDPYHPYTGWNAGEIYRSTGQFERAVSAFRSVPYLSPGLRAQTAASLAGLGKLDEARAEMKHYLELVRAHMPRFPSNKTEWRKLWSEAVPYEFEEDSETLFELLLQAGLCDESDNAFDDIPSILVLPFGNLSGDPEQDYFSDGITESIIVTLSASSALKVKSRHTSFAYRDSLLSLDQIGAKLEVQYIVEGSIRKHDDQVRITIQLSETASGNQVWGKRYDRPLAELFALEEELVQTIAGSISGRIGHSIKVSAKQRPANNPKSYDYLMRGWYHGERFTLDDNKAALESFTKCVELDPGNAHALSLIAATFNVQRYENWCADHEAASAQAEQYINRALEFEPDNALAHSFMAEHLLFERKFEQALFHCDQAIDLEPGLPDGYGMKGYTLCLMGRIVEAVPLAEQSLRVDPYHFYMGWNAGGVFRTAGAYQKAIDTYRLIPVPPPSLNAEIAACLVGLGEVPAARTAMTEYLRLSREQMPNYPTTESAWRQVWTDSYNYELDSDFESFWEQLLTAGLCDNLELPFDAIPAVAVLPLQNLSSDKEQEYFSDGITSSLIMSMGLFNGLNVRSQNSSFALRNSEKSSKEIAQELAADFLIEGSIRKSGSKVRLAVQLVEAETDTQIWSKQYDAELVDILDLEQELSATVAATISGHIGHRIQQSAGRKPANSLESYDYLLRGLYYMGKFTAADMELAQQQIEKCIALDPDNAEAHMQLGVVHTLLRYENWTSDRQETLNSEGKYLTRALELAPDNAQVHAYYAEHLLSKRDFEQAEFHANKAIELNPTAVEGYTVKADIMGFTRRYDEALNLADQCFRLDPIGVGTSWVAGDVYRITGNYEKAIRTLRSISDPPATIHALIAASFVGLGQLDRAKAEMAVFLKRAHTEMPNKPESRAGWRKLYKQSSQYKYEEDFEELFSMLLQAGLCDERAEGQDDIPSIAVLPFENMSGDAEQSFFSDGITADIISTLSKFKHLRIVARHSTEIYREQKASITKIADEQKVRYILEGNVRKSGKRIRVSAVLIDSETGQNCWSERYDRELDNLFAVQDELTQQIALAMKVQLDDGDMARHRSAGTRNIKAWELTLTAVDLQDTYIQQNIVEARNMAKQALTLDPEYVFAHVVLAWTFWQEVYGGWSDDPEKSLVASETSCQLALQLDPDSADALAQAGTGYIMRHNTDKAMEYSRRAVELEPGNAENQALRAFACVFAGDYEQARVYEQNMRRLCPVMPNWYYLILGQIEQFDGDLDQAIAIYKQATAVEPDSTLCRFYLVHALMQKEDTSAAQKFADEIRALDSSANGGGLARAVSKDAAVRDQFHQHLAQFGLA